MTKSLLSFLPLLFLLFSAKADLVAHYALDETGPSTLVTDCLGNNHGTLIGSATPTKGFPSPHATGNDGSGIRIDLGSSGNKVRALLRDGNGSSNTSVSSPLTLSLSNGNWYFFALRYDSLNGTCKLTYNDEHPWPEAPDGGGFSLVRISPANKLPPNNPTSWRSSTDLGGNPGTTDSTTFPGGDLLDYSLQEQALIPIVNGVIVPRNLAADDLIQVLQTSTDLLSWTPLTKPISESPQLPLHPTNLHSLPLDSKTLLPPKSHPPLTLPIKSHSNHPANDL